MREPLQSFCLKPDATLRDAMASLEASGLKIVVVLDADSRILGVLTDGDMRRALLAGMTMQSKVESAMNRRFRSVTPSVGRAEVLDMMQALVLTQLPVVDDQGRLVGLHSLHELLGVTSKTNPVVIMAGGKGTRLRPITENIPKPMVPVAGRPILERLVLHLVGCGFSKIYLSVNYLAGMIEKHFGDGSKFGCSIEYLRETQEMGTGGALTLLPQKPTEPLLVMNGDLVTQADLNSLLEHHIQSEAEATIGCRYYSHQVPFGCLESVGSKVESIVEKPMIEKRINAGIYVISPSAVELIPQTFYPITQLFEALLQQKRLVCAFDVIEEWTDVGEASQLRQARGQS